MRNNFDLPHVAARVDPRAARCARLSSAFVLLVPFALSLPGCGVFVMQKEHDALTERTAQIERREAEERAELAALRADLAASRERLENALRANADNGSELFSSKQRINEVAGRLDEVSHGVEENRRDLSASRAELSQRLDELKKQIPPPAPPAPPPPPPLAVPQDKAAHLQALREAKDKKDHATVRLLGPEYVLRYPNDDSADLALLLVAEADREDGRPASALGSYNRLLKLYPRSRLLDRTLYGMGEAYLTMHDCTNAKLAYQACDSRFAREKTGQEAKAKLALIAKAPPGLCAPPE
jgi:TolA-binding protein